MNFDDMDDEFDDEEEKKFEIEAELRNEEYSR